jgi:hypothetical protein
LTQTRPETATRIDAIMEKASRALVERRYFDCERLCVEALERSFIAGDYERMARILLPLEESRRQKRDLAIDAATVFSVTSDIPVGRSLRPGCYLVAPPRVGVDGRMLREAADKKKIPAVVVVREPASRDGMWPVVAIGPVTIRTKVPPPPPAETPSTTTRKAAKKSRAKVPAGVASAPPSPAVSLPAPSWFLHANEAIGDKALAAIEPTATPVSRVEALFKCLQAHPDHEKLHQQLADACREAVKTPPRPVRTRVRRPDPDEE